MFKRLFISKLIYSLYRNYLKDKQRNRRELRSSPEEYIDTSIANPLTLIKYVDFRAALKCVCDDFVGRGHYTRNYTSALIIP